MIKRIKRKFEIHSNKSKTNPIQYLYIIYKENFTEGYKIKYFFNLPQILAFYYYIIWNKIHLANFIFEGYYIFKQGWKLSNKVGEKVNGVATLQS